MITEDSFGKIIFQSLEEDFPWLEQSRIFFKRKSLVDTLTIGVDPEFILLDKDTKKVRLFSSRFTGDFYDVSRLAIGGDYGLLEIRTNPHSNPNSLIEEVNDLLKSAKEFLGRHNFEIYNSCVYMCDVKALQVKERLLAEKEGNEFINFGISKGRSFVSTQESFVVNDCTTYSAYPTLEVLEDNTEYLTCGGHIHFGGCELPYLSLNQLKQIVMLLDLLLTVPLIISLENECSKIRRRYYGRAGEFRRKEYGFEYRVLDNSLFLKNPTLLKKAYSIVENYLDSLHLLKEIDSSSLRKCINTVDKPLAKEVYNKIK